MYAFDAPRREECTAQRSRSNTPSAALVLLNDPTFVEAAKTLAEKILVVKSGVQTSNEIDLLFQTTIARTPDALRTRIRSDNDARRESPSV